MHAETREGHVCLRDGPALSGRDHRTCTDVMLHLSCLHLQIHELRVVPKSDALKLAACVETFEMSSVTN